MNSLALSGEVLRTDARPSTLCRSDSAHRRFTPSCVSVRRSGTTSWDRETTERLSWSWGDYTRKDPPPVSTGPDSWRSSTRKRDETREEAQSQEILDSFISTGTRRSSASVLYRKEFDTGYREIKPLENLPPPPEARLSKPLQSKI